MEDKKKNIIISVIITVVVIIFVVFGALACFGDFREFDARGYVTAMLDKTLKGDVEAASELLKESTTKAELITQYEETIKSVAKSSLPTGMELTKEMEAKYVELCKKMFASMKYNVKEAVKINDTEFEVPVEYQPADIYQKFEVLILAERQRIEEKKENLEYRGTEAEINTKMEEEFTNSFCGLFEEAFNTMEFGEKQTMVLKVIKDEKNLYRLETTQISEFITKIVGFGEIQD